MGEEGRTRALFVGANQERVAGKPAHAMYARGGGCRLQAEGQTIYPATCTSKPVTAACRCSQPCPRLSTATLKPCPSLACALPVRRFQGRECRPGAAGHTGPTAQKCGGVWGRAGRQDRRCQDAGLALREGHARSQWRDSRGMTYVTPAADAWLTPLAMHVCIICATFPSVGELVCTGGPCVSDLWT